MEENNSTGESIKSIVIALRDYTLFFYRNLIWIIIAGLIGGAVGFFTIWKKPTTYTAELSFMVNEDEGSNIGGVGALLGQLGIGISGGGEYNLDKIVELGKSRRILSEVLLDTMTVEGKKTTCAERIVELYLISDAWQEDPQLKEFSFSIPLSDSLAFNKALKYLHASLLGRTEAISNELISIGYRKETGILKISSTTISPDLSLFLANNCFEELSEFYINKSIERYRTTYLEMSSTSDSISSLLAAREFNLAVASDQSLGIISESDRTQMRRLSREVNALSIMYGEALKNLETSRLLLESATPFFQIIDQPIPPLNPDPTSKVRRIVIYSFLFTFCSMLLLLGVNLVKSTLE